jgi:hypothetical protein
VSVAQHRRARGAPLADLPAAPPPVAYIERASIAGAVYFVLRRDRRRAGDSAPWERDRNWPRDRAVRTAFLRELEPGAIAVTLLLVVGALLMPQMGTFTSGHLVWISLAAAGVAAYLARDWLVGGLQVRWDEFPMRTGTRVRLHVAMTAGGTSMSEFSASLRCVESAPISEDLDSAARVAACVPCATPGPLAAGPDEFVTVEFDIPADAPGTDLSCRGDERYWELVVMGTTAWGRIAETFVVPIYAVQGASAEDAGPAGGS